MSSAKLISVICFISAQVVPRESDVTPCAVGNITTVGAKRFRCAEVCFQPSFSASGIHVTELPVSYNIFRYAEMLFRPITYELTDGKIITENAKRFRYVEVLFLRRTYDLPHGIIFTVGNKR